MFLHTKVINISSEQPDPALLAPAAQLLIQGELVAFPTETVYGLGGDALNAASSGKIYAAKGRPSDNPLIVHICRLQDLDKIVEKIPDSARRMAEAYWPGPLTMIFQKADCVPYETTGGLDTVAVRMPSHRVARALIHAAGGYVAAPSANLSGKPSPTTARYVQEDMTGRIEMIIDGGMAEIGLESTIVDVTEEIPMILRPGYITREMLTELLGDVTVDRTVIDNQSNQAPRAPGMKYRHYAPKGDLTIIEGNQPDVIEYINLHAKEAMKKGERAGIIGTDETVERYRADSIKSAGKRADEHSVAQHLYSILREFDDENISVIYAESFADTGMGQAIMNRLLKAAGHHVIHIEGGKRSDSTGQ